MKRFEIDPEARPGIIAAPVLVLLIIGYTLTGVTAMLDAGLIVGFVGLVAAFVTIAGEVRRDAREHAKAES